MDIRLTPAQAAQQAATVPRARRLTELPNMPRNFAGQVAIITGASSGIGWALAKVLAAEGCKVGLVARRRDKLEELAGEIKQVGGITALATADVGDREQVHAAFTELARELGPVDLMVA